MNIDFEPFFHNTNTEKDELFDNLYINNDPSTEELTKTALKPFVNPSQKLIRGS